MPFKDPEKKKEYTREYNSKWYRENKERKQEYDRKCYQESEKKRETNRKWRQENPDKVSAKNAKRNASKLQRTPCWLTKDDLFMIEEAYALAKLRDKVTWFKWHVDHIVPLQGKTVSGMHVPNNLQVIPGVVNVSKHNNWNWYEQR